MQRTPSSKQSVGCSLDPLLCSLKRFTRLLILEISWFWLLAFGNRSKSQILNTRTKNIEKRIFDIVSVYVFNSYGYSNMTYISSLISGVGIFCFGTGLAWYHGVSVLLHPQEMESAFWVRQLASKRSKKICRGVLRAWHFYVVLSYRNQVEFE